MKRGQIEVALQAHSDSWLDDVTVLVDGDSITITGIRSAIFREDPAEWHEIANDFIRFLERRCEMKFVEGKMINDEGIVGVTLEKK